jgi:hypothetical protein
MQTATACFSEITFSWRAPAGAAAALIDESGRAPPAVDVISDCERQEVVGGDPGTARIRPAGAWMLARSAANVVDWSSLLVLPECTTRARAWLCVRTLREEHQGSFIVIMSVWEFALTQDQGDRWLGLSVV